MPFLKNQTLECSMVSKWSKTSDSATEKYIIIWNNSKFWARIKKEVKIGKNILGKIIGLRRQKEIVAISDSIKSQKNVTCWDHYI
jgi:hypothetical protein